MSYFLIYPSSSRICAIASFILDEGTSTVSCFAVFALRILVSISAIGSLSLSFELPPSYQLAFFYAGDLSFICQFTEADSADSVFS